MVAEYNFEMRPFDGKYNILQKSFHAFLCELSLTISKILMFQMFGLESVGQDYGVQFLQWQIRWEMSKYTNVIFTLFR